MGNVIDVKHCQKDILRGTAFSTSARTFSSFQKDFGNLSNVPQHPLGLISSAQLRSSSFTLRNVRIQLNLLTDLAYRSDVQ
jgi:hypothetical protein